MTAHTGLAVSPTDEGTGTTPQGFRLAVGGLLAKDGSSPLAVRRGILFDGQGAVVSGTGGNAYEVRPCVAVVMPSPTQGPVVVPTSATVTVPTIGSPGSNSRIDVIWVRQRLLPADAGSDTTVVAEWGVSDGDPSATPIAPPIPTGALEVARAIVTAGAANTSGLTISQTHPWTAGAGAPIPVRNDTERNALTGYDGLLVNHLGRKTLERHDGTTWRAYATTVDSGWVPLTIASGYKAFQPGTFGTPAARNLNGLVKWRGAIERDGASFPAGNQIIARAPINTPGLRPATSEKYLVAGENSTRSNPIIVDNEGGASLAVGSNVPAYVSLSDIDYFIG